MICFSVGSCWLFITIIQDITDDLTYLNCNEITDFNIQSKKAQLYNIVKFYLGAKQLSCLAQRLLYLNFSFEIDNFLVFRLMDEFNRVYENVISIGFFWTRIAISSSLLIFQIQLVRNFYQYFWNYLQFPNSIVFFLSEWTCSQSRRNKFNIFDDFFILRVALWGLLTRWNCNRPIWNIQCDTLLHKLVFLPEWITANDGDIHGVCSTTNNSWPWIHRLQARSIQKGEFYSGSFFTLQLIFNGLFFLC